MDKLSKCIDYLNHFTTLSLKDSYILRYKNSPLENPNYNDSISLYDFLYSFGKMYKSFKEDLDNLPKFNLGESFQYWDYSEYGSEKETTLLVDKPNIVDNDFCYLNIIKSSEGIKCYVSTDDHEYYFKNNEVKIDESHAEKYFTFIEKYLHFIDCYNISKGNTMFSNQHYLIISDYSGDIYNKIDNIILKIDIDFQDRNYVAKIIFDLNNLSIDYDKSLIEGVIGNKKDAINTLINEICINKSRIAPVYTDTEEEKTLRLKKGLDI